MSEENAVPIINGVDETQEFVTHSDFVAFENRVLASLTELKGGLSSKIDRLIESKMEHKLDVERKARNKQVEQLTKSVEDLNTQVTTTLSVTNTQLTIINSKFELIEALPSLVGELSVSVAGLVSTIEERQETAKINSRRIDERNKEQDERLDKIDARITHQSKNISGLRESVTTNISNYTSLFTDVNTLHTTIHGDVGVLNGAPSLFQIINELQASVVAMQKMNTDANDAILKLANSNAKTIAGIQDSIAKQAEIWKTRKRNMIGFLKELSRSRLAWGLGGTSVLTKIFGDDVLSFIMKFLSE